MIIQLCCTVLHGFVTLPLPRHSFFFCSCPSFLDEPREETLATQSTTSYEAVTKHIIRTQLDPFDNCLRPLNKKIKKVVNRHDH